VRIGVGLPTTTPGTDRALLLEWARRADQGPFTSLGVVDRIAYNGYEPMLSLAAVAAVTERVRLVTMVLIGPTRNTTLLAKEAATLDLLSGGRLTLGLSIGARHDDYELVGVESSTRGAHLSEQLADLRTVWEDGTVLPRPAQPGGPRLLVGGASGAAFHRMARYADGYVHGGGPPRAFEGAAARARAAWSDIGRPSDLELWGQAYFSLGDADAGAAYLRDYYAFTGPFAEKVVAQNLTTALAVKEMIRGYAEAGCDELVLLPTVSDLSQIDKLAEVLVP
jgi:alkanesulfonate monooxygenase SsuD/methylene tetrahydromethanopterin reductase-like flavin-dependent oxidoreductase (luciferase family)